MCKYIFTKFRKNKNTVTELTAQDPVFVIISEKHGIISIYSFNYPIA